VGVEVSALRHAAQEGAQLRVVVARRVESASGDDSVEFARNDGKAGDDDDGRQKNDGKDDPALHGETPRSFGARRLDCA